MSRAAQSPGTAWEPVTPRGVAAFARASAGRLLLAQLLVALLAGMVVVWFLHQGWFPVIRTAIRALPAEGALRDGRLDWTNGVPVQLAGNRFLGIAVDMNHSAVLGREAHLQVEFGRQDLRLISLLGYWPVDYPPSGTVPFNRTELAPWWGAWEPVLLGLAGAGTALALLLTWGVLATIYALPVWIIGWLQRRELNLRQSWFLAAAALLPGALFLIFGIFAYTVGLVDLIRLAGMLVLHFLVGWVYLCLSPLFLPRRLSPAPADPFQPPEMPAARGISPNPFAPAPAGESAVGAVEPSAPEGPRPPAD